VWREGEIDEGRVRESRAGEGCFSEGGLCGVWCGRRVGARDGLGVRACEAVDGARWNTTHSSLVNGKGQTRAGGEVCGSCRVGGWRLKRACARWSECACGGSSEGGRLRRGGEVGYCCGHSTRDAYTSKEVVTASKGSR